MKDSWVYGACVWLAGISTVVVAEMPPPPQDFATIKLNTIQRLNNELACVKVAKSEQEMHKCRQQPPGGAGHPDGPPPGAPPGQ